MASQSVAQMLSDSPCARTLAKVNSFVLFVLLTFSFVVPRLAHGLHLNLDFIKIYRITGKKTALQSVERQYQLGVCKPLKELLENLFYAQINVLTNFSKL